MEEEPALADYTQLVDALDTYYLQAQFLHFFSVA